MGITPGSAWWPRTLYICSCNVDIGEDVSCAVVRRRRKPEGQGGAPSERKLFRTYRCPQKILPILQETPRLSHADKYLSTEPCMILHDQAAKPCRTTVFYVGIAINHAWCL